VNPCRSSCSDSFFYSLSQGRASPHFDDRSDGVISRLNSEFPEAVTMEMETFHLLDLARCAIQPMAAAAAVICVANRHTNEIVDTDRMRELETEGGRAVMSAIAAIDLNAI